ncbi:MAG: VWA domain-containing protein [Sandaracinaceae bacterium]|nr:VWA domain-containing protein [Sandaracinaceae bacterium]
MAVVVSAVLSASLATAQTTWIDGSPIQTRLRVGADGTTYVGVWIDAPNRVVTRTRAPMAISLVVDTSGSMAGDKIQNARLAAASLLESAADGDIVSIYAFSNGVTEMAPPTVVSAATRASLMQRVGQLYAAGGTNLYGGVQAGLSRLSQVPNTHPVRRVFLISDGHANIGPSDSYSLSALAAGGTEWGAQISAIGVGLDYDQQSLSAMVVRSSGRLYHLQQPQQMATILEQEMSLLSRTVAVNAFIEVVPAPGVTILEGNTTGAEVVNGRLRLPLGSVFSGQHREVLFRARVDTAQPGSRSLAQARLVYQSPGEERALTEETTLRYEVTRDEAAARASQAPTVVAMVADHRATEAQHRAAEMMRSGQQDQAARELATARATLAAAAQAAPAAPSSARLRSRAQQMERAEQRAATAAPSEAPAAAYDFEDDAMSAEGY